MTLNKLRLQANEKGFTLIELMIVIAIIGILAAIAIPNYISYRNKAYCSAAESDANAILATLADYYAVPSRTGAIVGAIPTVGGGLLGVTFKALSNGNTANLANVAPAGSGQLQLRATVTDVSTRCPVDYRTSQTNAGWSVTAAGGTFGKTM
jgi:prepilin-type N-terminal cleavage/methylation domain-containing protein